MKQRALGYELRPHIDLGDSLSTAKCFSECYLWYRVSEEKLVCCFGWGYNDVNHYMEGDVCTCSDCLVEVAECLRNMLR
jgi:hypothetical protein